MISFNRKACKVLFQAACIIVVAFMVGYWFYKFEIEDRDIGVVDYVSLTDAKEIKFPIVSWCLKKPFIDEKLKATNSSITSTAYGQYLEGKIYDKSFEQVDVMIQKFPPPITSIPFIQSESRNCEMNQIEEIIQTL